jgi:peptidoglycan hydrolase-like protein with peptidoglycan-binding domain
LCWGVGGPGCAAAVAPAWPVDGSVRQAKGEKLDQMVLAAQQWVNATYTGVTGYVVIPETGNTGWTTMYALTRALQYELGLATLSTSFGPGTLGALKTRGGVKLTETNTNIIKIVQAACYCKGYQPGAIDGVFSSTTRSAVTNMARNAGVYGDTALISVVEPKVMKALLTMDAYTVVSGGSSSVRSVQQWLNGTYITKTNYYIVPCDGIFSRDIQKALYLAVQFQLGMSDADATGVFGPATKAGLNSHQLAEGDVDTWVQIFTAAMVVNAFFVRALDTVYTKFTNSFDADVVVGVRAFQKFSQLPVTERADYATWCQLLASTGDPDRPGTGADCVNTVTAARAQTLKAAGYTTIGRYLDNVLDVPDDGITPLNKKLQPGELDIIFAAGLKVFPIFQWGGSSAGYFTYSRGWDEGLAAHNAATGYGFNQGTVIYFAVDYDATQAEIEANILPYFKGVAGALALKGSWFVHGVYGSRNVCTQVSETTYARWSFVSGMSTGFSGNMGFSLPDNWAFNQIQTKTIGTGTGVIEIDKDVYRGGTDPASSSVRDQSSPMADIVDYVRQIYNLAVSFGQADASLLTLQYMRYQEYGDVRFSSTIGGYNSDFIEYALNAGAPKVNKRFNDPVYGVSLKTSHLAVAAEGFVARGQVNGINANGADLVGWGGDWVNFYVEWRLASDSYPSGYLYCQDKLAKVVQIEENGGFKLRDLIEDVDGYLIGMAVLGGQNIVQAFATHYQGIGYQSRFHRFHAQRFGSASSLQAVAKTMLLPNSIPIVDAARLGILVYFGHGTVISPELLVPSSSLDNFCVGLSDTIDGFVNNEVSAVRKAIAAGRI